MAMSFGFLAGGEFASVRRNSPLFAPLVVKWWSNDALPFLEADKQGSPSTAAVLKFLGQLRILGASQVRASWRIDAILHAEPMIKCSARLFPVGVRHFSKALYDV